MKKANDKGYVGDLFPDFEPIAEQATSLPKKKKPSKKDVEIERLKQEICSLQQQNKNLQEQNNGLQKEVTDLKQTNTQLQTKATAYDNLIHSESSFSTGVIAKSFGWSAVKLNNYLEKKKIQFFKSGIWMLYQKYAGKGYTHERFYNYHTCPDGKKLSRAHTYWTIKGYEFIQNLLKTDGLL